MKLFIWIWFDFFREWVIERSPYHLLTSMLLSEQVVLNAECTQFFVNPVPSPWPLCDVGVILQRRTRATYSSFNAHQVSAVTSSVFSVYIVTQIKIVHAPASSKRVLLRVVCCGGTILQSRLNSWVTCLQQKSESWQINELATTLSSESSHLDAHTPIYFIKGLILKLFYSYAISEQLVKV